MNESSQNSGGGRGGAINVLSQEHLTTILNASHDVVFILRGRSQTILHVNETVHRVLGYHVDDLIGESFGRILCESAPDYLDHSQFFDGVFGPVSFLRADDTVCKGEVTAAVIPWDGAPALMYTLRDATQRAALEEERAALIHDLQQALAAVQQLSGMLPICANCKRIRDDDGYWETVEQYIGAHTNVHFSHSICPTCREELYPGYGPDHPVQVVIDKADMDSRFQDAVERMAGFNGKVSRVNQLRLYALYQQGMFGDCAVAHIDITDGGARARVDGWRALHGMSMARARAQYIALVDDLLSAANQGEGQPAGYGGGA